MYIRTSPAAPRARPGLCRGVRLVHDPVRDRPALLYPEGVLLLNQTAAAALELCDGVRTIADITEALARTHEGIRPQDTTALLSDLAARRLIRLDGGGRWVEPATIGGRGRETEMPLPLGLLAVLTYRCPLRCPFCATPTRSGDHRRELSTSAWLRVLDEARALGVLQVHLSGGEPLFRRDLAVLVRRARRLGLYTNLVTTGIPLNGATLEDLMDAGLDHLQLSIRDGTGGPAHEPVLAAARLARAAGLPLTINAVLPRADADHVAAIAELAAAFGADRLELAHAPFYGRAWLDRAGRAPTPQQVREVGRAAAVAGARYGDRMDVVHVAGDYHTGLPQACVDGWGSRQLIVTPPGDVLPCLSARVLPDLTAPSVRHMSLRQAWFDSPAFNRFRGTEWLPEPCRSCVRREVDFGGCRCQAYLLTGDPSATDPACAFSPLHHLVAVPATVDAARNAAHSHSSSLDT